MSEIQLTGRSRKVLVEAFKKVMDALKYISGELQFNTKHF